jgi:hypothetical protein
MYRNHTATIILPVCCLDISLTNPLQHSQKGVDQEMCDINIIKEYLIKFSKYENSVFLWVGEGDFVHKHDFFCQVWNMIYVTSLNLGVLLEIELWSATMLVDASNPLSSFEDDASKECFRDSDLELAYGSTCCLMLLHWADDVLSCHNFFKKVQIFTGINNEKVLKYATKRKKQHLSVESHSP